MKSKTGYPKLIGHNQKKKAFEIFDKAHNIMVYTLDNYFVGKKAEKIGFDGKNWMTEGWLRMARSQLTENSPGHYTLHFHSNRWVEFQA